MRLTAPIGIAGGSFDPVHNGHLRMALELRAACALAEVRFVPAARPPHRSPPVAEAELRLRMLEAAIAGCPGFVVDRRELGREGPSYTVHTLESLRAEWPERPLCLLLGLDAFLGITGWYRWTDVLQLAHVVVATRPGSQLPAAGPAGALLAERAAPGPASLAAERAGRILVQPVTQLEISSSAIRALVGAGGDPRFLVPDPVRELIGESACYRPALAGQSSRGYST